MGVVLWRWRIVLPSGVVVERTTDDLLEVLPEVLGCGPSVSILVRPTRDHHTKYELSRPRGSYRLSVRGTTWEGSTGGGGVVTWGNTPSVNAHPTPLTPPLSGVVGSTDRTVRNGLRTQDRGWDCRQGSESLSRRRG